MTDVTYHLRNEDDLAKTLCGKFVGTEAANVVSSRADAIHANCSLCLARGLVRLHEVLAGTDAHRNHQIGLLLNAIRDIGVAAGVLREDVGTPSGPEALMFAEDTVKHVRRLRADVANVCACTGYANPTDYGTGVEHDVDRSSCPIHSGLEGPSPLGEPTQEEMAQGHLFEFSVRSWGVSRMVGDPTYIQSDWTLAPKPVYVRSFSLDGALREALDLPLDAWFEMGEED